MEPPHMTEFASARYFNKLAEQQQQQDGGAVEGPSAPAPSFLSQQSPFILPLRDSKPVDADDAAQPVEPKQKKSRFGFTRLLHRSHPTTEVPEQRGPSFENIAFRPRMFVPPTFRRHLCSARLTWTCSTPFDELFLNLPTELQIQVIASLPLSDILNLRLASNAWHQMVMANESPIVRYHLDHHIPAYAKRLYPPGSGNLTLHYLCGLWHRLHVAAKLSVFICEWATKEIFLRTTEAQKREFAGQRERMRRRLIPLVFTIFHFFENYRERHVQFLRDNGRGLQQTPYTLNPIELEVMSMYDDRTLLQVHQVFPLVVASFCRRLRPPSYVGRVERSIRGYLREKPPDEVHVAALCVGGLRQVERFWEIKGYNTRRGAVDVWYNSVTKEPVDLSAKSRRGLMGLGRKKSTMALKDTAAAAAAATTTNKEGFVTRRGSEDFNNQDQVRSSVSCSSLSAGSPMGPLSRDDLRLLIPDLPVLQQLWVVTAEALILEKKIVERASDIRRNAHVLLELIREEGVAEEDEWWYGQGAHDSVRPPLDSIEEDAIEEDGPP